MGFTKEVKVVKTVKSNYKKEKKLVIDTLLALPVIDSCNVCQETNDGFVISLRFEDENTWEFNVIVLKKAYPKVIVWTAEHLSPKNEADYSIIVAPYVSEAAAKLCGKHRIGFMDESGNVQIVFRSLYIIKAGYPNRKPEVRNNMQLFNPHSVTSSLILRKLLDNPQKLWKLKYLSQEVGCSIGMVSRVKDALCNQLWAEMTPNGFRITDSKAVLKAWSQKYVLPEQTICYTLEPLPVFEKKLRDLKSLHGIHSCLTGFSGGVRYAPVVRYNRIHLFVPPEDIDKFIALSGCKPVDSGANVILMSAREDYISAAREQNGDMVVSPVQAYLDCMQLKGRGEELAEAIFVKEIQK